MSTKVKNDKMDKYQVNLLKLIDELGGQQPICDLLEIHQSTLSCYLHKKKGNYLPTHLCLAIEAATEGKWNRSLFNPFFDGLEDVYKKARGRLPWVMSKYPDYFMRHYEFDKYQRNLRDFINENGGQIRTANLLGIAQSTLAGYLLLYRQQYLSLALCKKISRISNGKYLPHDLNPLLATQDGVEKNS